MVKTLLKIFYLNIDGSATIIEPLGSIGSKRNYACGKAQGEIIIHWDDDDYYGYDWINQSIEALERSGADICGLNEIMFYSPIENKYWTHKNEDVDRPYIAGATMAYSKDFWKKHPFKDIQIGEDYDYVWNSGAKIFAHNYKEGFIATLHSENTTLKPFEKAKFKKHAIQWMDVPFMGNTENPE